MDIRNLLLDIEIGRYRSGLRRLRESFYAASTAFLQEIEVIENARAALEEAVSRGERTWEIIDEDGLECGNEGEHLQWLISDAEENLMLLRKAFLVLIYHHWERSAQVWLEDLPKKPNHEKIVTALRKRGFFIPPQLEKLRMITNTIKHNSRCAEELYHSNPEYFNSDANFTKRTTLEGKMVSKDPDDIDWEGNMHLTNENLDYFIKVARECALPAPSSAS